MGWGGVGWGGVGWGGVGWDVCVGGLHDVQQVRGVGEGVEWQGRPLADVELGGIGVIPCAMHRV